METTPFLTGINYWPRRKAMYWWSDFDRAEVADEFDIITDLDMDVVAEGVESEDQLAFLQRLGCTYAQGLLFGDPMSSDSYLELLLAQAEGTDTYRALFA